MLAEADNFCEFEAGVPGQPGLCRDPVILKEQTKQDSTEQTVLISSRYKIIHVK